MSHDATQPWKALSTAYKETAKGPTFYDFTASRVVLLRAAPLGAWRLPRGRGRLHGTRDPDVLLCRLIREVRAEDERAHAAQTPLPLSDSPYQTRRRENLRRWLAHLDPLVPALVGDGWEGIGWTYLRWLQSSSRAREIACSPNGAPLVYALSLAHAVAERVPRRIWPWLEGLLKGKRKHAVAALGLPPQPASVEALAKIPRAHLHADTLKALRVALSHPDTAKRVWHAPLLSFALLSALAPELLPHVAPPLLDELARRDEPHWQGIAPVLQLRDAVSLAGQLDARVGVLDSTWAIHALHENLMRRARRAVPRLVGPLPPLPIALTETERAMLVPLTSFEALRAEGDAMEHCLGTLHSQLDAARAGRLHAFRVERPERATLAVWRPKPGAAWEVYDVRGPHNSPASDALWTLARDLALRLERERVRERQLAMSFGAHALGA